MKEHGKIMEKLLKLVMNKKVRFAVKLISALIWIAEKGIDIFEDLGDQIDEQMYIDNKIEESMRDEVRKEIMRIAKSNEKEDEQIKAFLKSVANK